MTAERAHRILSDHGASATIADAARLLDVLVPLSRHALRVSQTPRAGHPTCVGEPPATYTAAPGDPRAVQTRAASPPPVPCEPT